MKSDSKEVSDPSRGELLGQNFETSSLGPRSEGAEGRNVSISFLKHTLLLILCVERDAGLRIAPTGLILIPELASAFKKDRALSILASVLH